MSWQEELRRIDNDLAAGKLSKEQYAARREEVLAAATSTTAPGAKPPPPAKPAEPEPPEADTPPDVLTRVPLPVPAKDLLTTDRQTTAPSPADQRSTDSMPHPPVRPRSTPQPAPIAKTELPPPVPKPPPQPAAAQGWENPGPPELPTENQPRGRVPTWLFLVLGTILAVGVIGAGLWWLTSDNGDDRRVAEPPTTSSTPRTPAPTTGNPELIDRLPELPGVLNRNSGTFSAARGAKLKLYGADEALVLRNQDVREVTWKGSSRGAGDAATAYVILVAENADESAAAATADALRKLGESRVKPTDPLDGHEGLSTFKRVAEKSNTYRVIYTSGGYTVRVGVVQTPGADEKRLVNELSELLTEVTAELPPNEG